MRVIESGGINENFISIHWELTHNCNFNCEYCFRKNYPIAEYLSKNDADNIIEHIKKIPHKIRLTLTGGEPTLYPHFYYVFNRLLNIKNIECLGLFSNSSHDLSYIIDDIKTAVIKIRIFLSYHPSYANDKMFIFNAKLLTKHNVKYETELMMEKNHYEKLINMYNIIKNNKNSIYALPLEPIEKQKYDLNFINFEKLVNTNNINITNNKEFYYKILNDSNEIIYEQYDISEMRKLPSFYHNFKLMKCDYGTFLVINPNGSIRARCDLNNTHPYNINYINELINKTKICTCNNCTNRDDIRLIHKYRK